MSSFGIRCVLCLFALGVVLGTGEAGAAPGIEVVALFKDKAVVQIDGHRRMLSVGMPGPDGVRLLSADSSRAVLLVDGKPRRFGLSDTVGGLPTAEVHRVVRVWPDNYGSYVTVGTVNGSQVDLVVDTGADRVAMNANEAARLGIDFRALGTPAVASTAAGRVHAFRVLLDEVSVGPIRLHNVDGLVVVGAYPRRVLLGMSFLNRITLSKRNGAMVLDQRR